MQELDIVATTRGHAARPCSSVTRATSRRPVPGGDRRHGAAAVAATAARLPLIAPTATTRAVWGLTAFSALQCMVSHRLARPIIDQTQRINSTRTVALLESETHSVSL